MKPIAAVRALLALLILASCAPAPAFGPAPGAGWKASAALYDVELEIHQIVNRERVANGLPPLLFDSEVAAVARDHSRAMAIGAREFGHDRFRDRARTARSLVPESRAVSENVASNLRDPAVAGPHAVRQWLESHGHRENIYDPGFAVTGVGAWRAENGEFFFTQLFVAQPRQVVAGRPSHPSSSASSR
jgi:uncharacterized protein YkwD